MKKSSQKTALQRNSIMYDHLRMYFCLFLIPRYLLDTSTWSQCVEPKHIVEWNVTLFSILLALGGIEFILCLVQVINGVLGGICGYCCSRQQVRTCVKMATSGPGIFQCQHAPQFIIEKKANPDMSS